MQYLCQLLVKFFNCTFYNVLFNFPSAFFIPSSPLIPSQMGDFPLHLPGDLPHFRLFLISKRGGAEGSELELQQGAAHLQQIFVVQEGGFGDATAVDKGPVGAVQILDKDLGALEKDAGVLPGDASLVPAMIGQVHIGEDTADRILPAHGDLGLAGREG